MAADEVSDPLERALVTLRAVRGPSGYDRRRQLYARRAGRWGGRRYEHLWPFANAWSAVASLAAVPAAPAVADEVRSALVPFLDAALAYRRVDQLGPAGRGFESSVVPPRGPGGDRYFDDNAWLGLAMVRHYQVLGEERALAMAQDAFAFVASGWDACPSLHRPGGVRWRDTPDSRSRHACSTAPAAELAVLLSGYTDDDRLLDWAVIAYRWVRTALRRADDLYADHLRPNGTVDPAVWSYNQGAMVGAGALLHRATGDSAYLADARATAAAARRRFGPAELVRHRQPFNAIYFRNLALLEATERAAPDGHPTGRGGTVPDRPPDSPEGEWVAEATAYGDERWEHARDPRTGRFDDGDSPLNASAPMIEIYALLAGAPGRP